jgi:two-component system CheB/CheR fusion protein
MPRHDKGRTRMKKRKDGANSDKDGGARRKVRDRKPDETHSKAELVHQQVERAHEQVHTVHQQAETQVGELRRDIAERTKRPPTKAPAPFEQIKGGRRTKKALAEIVSKEPEASLPFTVVGVGGSAGGFEAFVSMLRNFPTQSGVALVYIQHLDPHHESRLADLLSKVTEMPVREITNSMEVAPNRVYILPANASVLLSNGRLRLEPRQPEGKPMPIDVFFRSLAKQQQHRCMGVVLSGTGADGTLGLAEIKGVGGVTFAQEQGSAKYFGMPGSAIAAGLVDFILTPEGIAQEIARIAKHTYIAPAPDRKAARGKAARPVPDAPGVENLFRHGSEELKTLFNLLRSRTGVDFSLYKPGTLNRRIMRRMVLQKADALGAYVRLLQQHPGEVDALFSDLLITVTGFFRDPDSYTALQKKLLPKLLKDRPEDLPLRIWSCGCSTGEEAYSLAIAVAEYLEKVGRHVPVQIFASDLNDRGIEKARAGIYNENIALDVPPGRLRRYFAKVDGHYQVTKPIRDLCVFARQNLAVDPPFSNIDIISCRNVLIYLTSVLQKRIVPIFHYALKPGGFLMLGSSESLGDHSDLFELFDKTNKIYCKKSVPYRPTTFALVRQLKVGGPSRAPAGRPPQPEKADPDGNLQQKVDRLILHRYSPAAAVINEHMDVLHFRGKTAPYLEHQAGAASLNLLKMARDDLALDLRRVVTKAIQTRDRADAILDLRLDGKAHRVRVDVHPITIGPAPERYFAILFVDVTPGAADERVAIEGAKAAGSAKRAESRQIIELSEELSSTKESLQAIIEEQEATNEELKSANEEILSSNEELQSTNEELETAREELQSTNEELTTLNQELQTRNNELAQVNNDVTNLLSSVNIAIVMLGTDLTIRRFTPRAEKIFSLIPADVGRRLTDFRGNIQVPELEETIQNVIENLNTIEREAQDQEGHWYLLRIHPYRTRERRIDGVVLMLLDIDELKRSIGHIISLVRHPILAMQIDLKVTRANEAFCKLFRMQSNQVEGKRIYELGRRRWDIPRLRELLEELLPAHGEVRDYRIEHEFEHVGRKSLLVNARRFYGDSRGVQLVLLAMEEVTPK